MRAATALCMLTWYDGHARYTYYAYFQLSPSLFELIAEPLTEEGGGCGFIPEVRYY